MIIYGVCENGLLIAEFPTEKSAKNYICDLMLHNKRRHILNKKYEVIKYDDTTGTEHELERGYPVFYDDEER